MRFSERFRATKRAPLLQVLKSAVATVVAWLLAGWLIQGQLPVFAAIAALLVVQPSVNQSLGKAIERSVGVIAGVVIASLLGLVFGPSSWVILVAILVSMLAAWAARL
ncbi:MAG TPA: aromatic acid exporter family protein, partial [Agromyces sp.]|nr:aromatic acid exporter family protein [Agromyces sp.]